MISVQGNLSIRSINGRFGEFNVGALECSIGDFTIKDSTIDELEEGNYSGTFVIESIKPNSYFTGGRVVVEILAKLHLLQLDGINLEAPATPAGLERDPIEEDAVEIEVAEQACSQSLDAESDEGAELAELFGILWPIESTVKLDPTISRVQFRQQKDYLKSNGYSFDVQNQHWIKKQGV